MRLAIDLEGGDHSPVPQARGALAALQEDPELTLILVGAERHALHIGALQQNVHDDVAERLKIIIAPEIVPKDVTDDASISTFARNKKTTMHVATSLVANGDADAVLTSGNTAGLVAISTTRFGRLSKDVLAALMVRLPSKNGHDVIFLDVGANPNTSPEQLAWNAQWGSICARHLYNLPNPHVRLLSNGEEPGKGGDRVQEAHDILKTMAVNDRGNVEPDHLFSGKIGSEDVHVVAVDGFTGNASLKSLATGMKSVQDLVKTHIDAMPFYMRWPMQVLLLPLLPTFRRVRANVQAKVGSAMVLGVNGLAFKVHGNADAAHVKAGILSAHKLAKTSILDELRKLHGTP